VLSLGQQRNSRQQGEIGLTIAIAWFVQNGFHVAIPLTDSQDYDLVVETDGRFYAVQVRTTYHRRENGVYQLNMRVCGGNRSGTGKVKHFDPHKVDYLFAITDVGDKYLIPSQDIMARRSINLGDKYAEYQVE
jgi:hypothetical protein